MHLPGNRVAALLAILFILCPAMSPAQNGAGAATEADDKTYEIKEITVTGTRDTESDANPAIPVATRYGTQRNVVTEEQIERQESLDLQSALRNVPGVMFQSKNVFGSQTGHSLYVRGRGASHPSADFAVQFDGAPRYGALYGQVLGDGAAVSTIGGIEVFKSPQPSQFGSGYASINILPKFKVNEGRMFELDLGMGAFGTFDQSLSGGHRAGPFDLYLSQSWTSTDGHVDHSRAQQQSYYVNTGFRINQEWDLRFLASYVNAQTLAPKPDNSPGASQPMAERFDTETLFSTLTLNHHYGQFEGFVKAYWNDTDFDLLEELNDGVPYAGGGVSSVQEIMLYGIRAKEEMRLWKGGEIVAGADLDYSELTNIQKTNSGLAVPGVNGGRVKRVWNFPDITLFSPYIAVSQRIGVSGSFHLVPSAGIRIYAHDEFESAASPQTGIVIGWRNTDFAFNYARGVNYPSPVVLQALTLDSSTVENPAQHWSKIKPEAVDHFEISLTHAFPGRATLGMALFRDNGKNRFRAYMFGSIPALWNDPIGEYKIDGLEISAAATPRQDFDLSAGVTWLDSEATGNDGVKRSRLPYTPKFQAQAGVDWKFYSKCLFHLDVQRLQGVYSSTNFRTQGFNFAELNESLRLDNSTLVNVKASRFFDWPEWGFEDLEIYLAINNLFNDHYQYAPGYDMPGIAVFGGMKVRIR